MSQVTTEQVKALRELTGAGIMDCKRALEESECDLERAREILRQRGIIQARKRASQPTREGLVEAYIHAGARIGAMVEFNCETDFVARTDEFRTLAHDLAMQVAAMNPRYLSQEELSPTDGFKPEEVCLLQQPFIKDPTQTVQDLVTELSARTGENIRVRRFVRFALGQD